MTGARPRTYSRLTWDEWRRMHWRERAKVRAVRTPPKPPRRITVHVTERDYRSLSRAARAGGLSISEFASIGAADLAESCRATSSHARERVETITAKGNHNGS